MDTKKTAQWSQKKEKLRIKMTHWTQYSNNANSTKTDRKIIAILSVRNITISKKFINMNTKLVVDLQKIAARGKVYKKKNIISGAVDQESTIP